MKQKELTEKEYWDTCWQKVKLPMEIRREAANSLGRELLSVLESWLPRRKGLKILEIGGAPGQWLAYFRKTFEYDISGLDYSDIGYSKMRENFELLNLPITIYKKDVVHDDLSFLPRFDIVCSFGFIEHFLPPEPVLQRHIELVKEGGFLVLGVPNFRGLAEVVLKKTAPRKLAMHNLQTMDIENWTTFEEVNNLHVIFKGYLGGFDLRNCKKCDDRTIVNRSIRFFIKTVVRITSPFGFLRKLNSKHWSPYLLLIYRKGPLSPGA